GGPGRARGRPRPPAGPPGPAAAGRRTPPAPFSELPQRGGKGSAGSPARPPRGCGRAWSVLTALVEPPWAYALGESAPAPLQPSSLNSSKSCAVALTLARLGNSLPRQPDRAGGPHDGG